MEKFVSKDEFIFDKFGDIDAHSEQGSFSPLVFSMYGGMGRECQAFYSRQSELLVVKRDVHKSVMIHWIRSKICYALLKSCLLRLRKSRSRNPSINEVRILQLNMNYL